LNYICTESLVTMAQQQQAYNVFAMPVSAQLSEKKKKFLGKKGGQFLILKDFKKDDYLSKNIGMENEDDEAYNEWFATNHKYGYNYNSYNLLEALRYAGIFESLLLNAYFQPVAYCSGQPAFYPASEDFALIDKIGKEDIPEITVFGKKYIRSMEDKDVGVWVGASAKVDGQEGPVELLGFARSYGKQLDSWKSSWAQGANVYAPTLIVRTYNTGTNISQIPDSIKTAMLGFGVGWKEDTKFRFQPPTLFGFLAYIAEKYTVEE